MVWSCSRSSVVVHAEIAGIDDDGQRLNLVVAAIESVVVIEVAAGTAGGSPGDDGDQERADLAGIVIGVVVILKVVDVAGVGAVPQTGADFETDDLFGDDFRGAAGDLTHELGICGICGVNGILNPGKLEHPISLAKLVSELIGKRIAGASSSGVSCDAQRIERAGAGGIVLELDLQAGHLAVHSEGGGSHLGAIALDQKQLVSGVEEIGEGGRAAGPCGCGGSIDEQGRVGVGGNATGSGGIRVRGRSGRIGGDHGHGVKATGGVGVRGGVVATCVGWVVVHGDADRPG